MATALLRAGRDATVYAPAARGICLRLDARAGAGAFVLAATAGGVAMARLPVARAATAGAGDRVPAGDR